MGAGVLALSMWWLAATHWPSPVLLVAAALFLILMLWRRPGPAAFVLADGEAFRVHPTGYAVWWSVLMAVALNANYVGLAHFTWEDDVAADPVLVGFGLVTVTVVGGLLRALWAGLPMVELTRDGVRVRSPFSSLAVPWDALRPGYPLPPALRADTLALTVDRSGRARRRGLVVMSWAVPLAWLDVHPLFLADAIRYYVGHPEHRAAIGTAAEHARLRQVLLAPGGPTPR